MEFLIKHKRDRQFHTFWNGWEQGLQLLGQPEVRVMTGWEPIVYAARMRVSVTIMPCRKATKDGLSSIPSF